MRASSSSSLVMMLPFRQSQGRGKVLDGLHFFFFSMALILLVSVVIGTTANAQTVLTPRCGDCWCIHNGELDSCPTDTTGIYDSFSDAFSIYDTFEQTNEVIKLQTPNGDENCYPFASTLGPVEDYPESNWPQCFIPQSTDETVCAYLYETNSNNNGDNTFGPNGSNEMMESNLTLNEESLNGEELGSCRGRKYQVLTYDSAEAATAAGAVVTHKGACGVCSNAADLWARMKTLDTFSTKSVLCAVAYRFNSNRETRFDELITCAQDSGFTYDCAKLWAHYGAATVAVCGDLCAVDPVTGTIQYNGPPPTCTLAECLNCPKQYNEFFGAMAGRTLEGSGITEDTARPCSSFYPVVHDPCVGAQATVSPAPTPPLPETSGSGGGAKFGTMTMTTSRIPTTWMDYVLMVTTFGMLIMWL